MTDGVDQIGAVHGVEVKIGDAALDQVQHLLGRDRRVYERNGMNGQPIDYAAAKAAVNSLTVTYAKELGPRIRVNCIMPGAVPTEIMMKAMRLQDEDLPKLEKVLRMPMRRLGTPDDLGQAVLYFVSPASSWVTGQILGVDGGL